MSSQKENNPQAGQGKPLPKKEADLFRAVIKYYETKLYKKGVKSADGILKKYPKHGETLAMKGLILNCLNKKEEAHELVKLGLMNDMRSHVCWHVYGLLYRSDRLYNEAIKAYKQALRIDHDNLQILRDLSLLQIQMRDLPGYESTRHQILDLKPNQKIHWLSFALSKHLCDDHEGCLSVIDSYLGTLDDDAVEKKRGFESSELALYQYEVMSEIPNNEQASLDYLDKCFDIVVDQTSWLSSKGRGQLMLGDYASAQQSYMKLFERGSTEDYQVHTGYMCALLELPKEVCDYALNKSRGGGAAMKGMDTIATIYPLTADQRATLLTAYTSDLVNRFPISKAAKRIPLTLLNGTCEEFKSAVNVYCRKLLVKGVPSLGADLGYLLLMPRPDGAIPPIARAYDLAKDPVDAKAHPIMAVLESVADGYITSLNTTDRTFPESDVEESPSTYLWALYLRAKLHEFCGEYSEGLKRIEDALEHTPTLVDLYELKGRLLKLSGDLDGAYQSLEEGRELDLQDRYINNKTIKYTLRAGKDDLAAERVALFTKDEGNPEQHMFDMQCTWYELELAACYANKRNWGKALKKYTAIESHFEDYHEDQFDFHSYCIRKVTLRSYVNLLRFEDQLWDHKLYQKAAAGLITIYLHLFDHPEDAKEGGDDELDYSKMTAAQKKKARKKKKQEEKKQGGDAAAGGDGTKTAEANTSTNNKKKNVETDPKGASLLALDHMEQAVKFSNTLVMHASKSLMSWLLRYDVAIRRNKKAMALQALFKAKAIDPKSPQVFSRIVDYSLRDAASATTSNGNGNGHATPSVVEKVLKDQCTALLQGGSLKEFVGDAQKEATKNKTTSLLWLVAVAEVMTKVDGFSASDAASLIVSCDLNASRDVSAKSCKQAKLCLAGMEDLGEATKKWNAVVLQRFPLSTKEFAD